MVVRIISPPERWRGTTLFNTTLPSGHWLVASLGVGVVHEMPKALPVSIEISEDTKKDLTVMWYMSFSMAENGAHYPHRWRRDEKQ